MANYGKKKKPAKRAPMMTMGSATRYITKQMRNGGPSAGAIKMAKGILKAAGEQKTYGGGTKKVMKRGGKSRK